MARAQPSAGGTGGSGGGGAAGAGGAGAVAAGDTSHCVGGRQFDPKLIPWAPPCAPGKPGEAFPNNGGATYTGVTGDQITIVDYISNYGAEVNAILEAQGSLVTYEEAKPFDTAMQNFINARYTLYGRKVKIVTYQGQCQSVPPNYSCLLPEMDRIVQQYKPYMLMWNTTLCSACFAEIARNKVVGIGGDGFTDGFAKANAPYFYAAGMSATLVEQAFADFWCKQLSSVNVPSRKVKWAGTQNPAQNFNGQPRRLGVISTNDPDNKNAVNQILGPALQKGCGDKIWHTYFYAQDINTAAQQVEAGIAAMNTPQNPANVVLCLCDQVAPAFLYQGEQNHNYWPENAIATNQDMDFDDVGQSYEDDGGSPSLACPTPARGCEYDNAFGLSPWTAPEPDANNAGVRMFKAGGGKDLPFAPKQMYIWARYWAMMANLIQSTGPNLTPQNMAAAAPKLGNIGGGDQPLLSFANGTGYWSQDVRVVYWNKNKVSPANGKKGSYVQIFDRRFRVGEFAALNDGPPIPLAKDRR